MHIVVILLKPTLDANTPDIIVKQSWCLKDLYGRALGPGIFFLILKFRVIKSKFRLSNSKFRLSNSKF